MDNNYFVLFYSHVKKARECYVNAIQGCGTALAKEIENLVKVMENEMKKYQKP